MNRVQELQQLFDFNEWANERVLESVSVLAEVELERDLRNSFPSIRDTLVHVLGAEWIWLERWKGNSPRQLPAGWQESTLPAVREQWSAVVRERRVRLDALTETELDRVIAYQNLAGTPYHSAVWQMLRHVVNHSTYHRGQVTTMLRQLGAVAASTDLIQYYRSVAAEVTAG